MPNHHFGSKEDLFAECVRYALIERMDFPSIFREPPVFPDAREATSRIAAKVRACFLAVHPLSGRQPWHSAILPRSLVENRPKALKAFREGLGPAREWFFPALKYARPEWTPSDVLFWYVSLWGQVWFYTTARSAILARAGKKRYDEEFLTKAADHLVQVMLQQLKEPGG